MGIAAVGKQIWPVAQSLHIGSIKAHLFLGENVDGQVGQVKVFQLHITDIVGVGDFHGVGVSLAVRPRFGAVAGFRFDGLGQDVLLFKEHGKVALYLPQSEHAVMQRGEDYGRVVNVVGLGGGNTFGLGEYVYLTHYADDANGSDTPYHELAHCLGYGHSGNMTYYPAEGGFPTICMKVYSQLSVSKKLPVYSRRFLHTRRNKNLVENKNVYTSSKYIIDDPELDAIDGGLGLAPMETDRAGDEGSPLSFTLSVLDIPGATVETFHPKAVHLYGNTLYVANDAPGHYSLEVFDVSSGNVRHVKSMVEWMNGDKKETFAERVILFIH